MSNNQNCISDADLSRLWEDDLKQLRQQQLQQHLDSCPQCKSRYEQMSAGAGWLETLFSKDAGLQLEKDFAEKGDAWWSEYAAEQIFGLLAQVPEQIDYFCEIPGVKTTPFVRSDAVIDLPIFQPTEGEVKRLAAATGYGFAEQTLRQEQPPFEFHLIQFGEQLKIEVSTIEENSPYKHCLARLELSGQDTCLLSKILLIDKGKSQSVLSPDDTHRIKPQQGHLSIKLTPLVTQQQLIEAGSEAYAAILTKLLEHNEPAIRCNTVKVIARILGTKAPSLIRPLANDKSEIVRTAVQKALKRFPYIEDSSERRGR